MEKEKGNIIGVADVAGAGKEGVYSTFIIKEIEL